VSGSLSHLVLRFFDVLTSKPLTASEIAFIGDWLAPKESELFLSQPVPDQRHGHYAASTVLAAGEQEASVIRAALLHDIGKRHARLGVMGRTFASLSIRLELPLGRRGSSYRDHGEIAARELSELGCEPLVVDFARHHHGERPMTIPPATWELLQLADEPPKTRSAARARIT
jgi:putative nucleotidyltransferase with HDIG domain